MPKTKISEYSVTNSSNTDIEGINIDEGCAPSGINNAIRELMVHLKEFQTGASGDAFTFAGGVLISGTANTITGNVLMSGTNTITGSTTATFAAGAVGTPSIAAHGDTNTGIFFPAADTIAFAEGGAEAMRIDSSGNVLIGTTSASGFDSAADNLIVGGGSGSTGMTIYSGTAGVGSINFADGTTGSAIYAGGINYNHNTNLLALYTNDGSTRMAIDSSGNVGIGTSSPATKLHVYQSNDALPALQLQHNDGDFILMEEGGGTDIFKFTRVASTNDLQINVITSANLRFATNATERARITSGGTMGINTTSPDAATVLTIKARSGENGMAVKAGTNGNYGIYFNNTSDATQGGIVINSGSVSYNTTSDYRLKENVQPLSNCLARVLQLKPCTYIWKADGSIAEGFIAHELAEICPQAVTGEKDATEIQRVEISPAVEATYDEDGNELTPAVEAVYEEREVPKYQGVDTSFLVATLTAAIQELKAITDAQATRIEALEAEVAAMKAGNGN